MQTMNRICVSLTSCFAQRKAWTHGWISWSPANPTYHASSCVSTDGPKAMRGINIILYHPRFLSPQKKETNEIRNLPCWPSSGHKQTRSTGARKNGSSYCCYSHGSLWYPVEKSGISERQVVLLTCVFPWYIPTTLWQSNIATDNFRHIEVYRGQHRTKWVIFQQYLAISVRDVWVLYWSV